nr:MAG TPA: hypothetical protein [Caudoviricetes sp.]
MPLINVAIYGEGKRNNRLRAEYICCDHAQNCVDNRCDMVWM